MLLSLPFATRAAPSSAAPNRAFTAGEPISYAGGG